jgi:hypothetical protein
VELFAAHNSKQAHDVVAAVAVVSLQVGEGEEPQWRQCTPEPAAASKAVEGDSEVADGRARMSPDAAEAVAVDSRCPTQPLMRSRPFGDRAVLQPFLLYGQGQAVPRAPCTWSGN